MRFSRIITTLSTLAGMVALGLHPGCSSSPSASPFADAGGDADAGPSLNFDAHFEGGLTSEGGFNDGAPTIDGPGCVPDASAVPGPVQHICVQYPVGQDDNNECDGHHDLTGFPANGDTGNGFDDNCNGLVDEGCSCTAPGTTKDCYLVPASQTSLGAPVGWCAENSKGTVDCLQLNGEGTPQWSGQCRGAQPPFGDDFCAPGDFNCDGSEENSVASNCSCKGGVVACPTAPVTTVPYPTPSALPLNINAASWFPGGDVSQAMNWKWTLRGGDCDNILPHPTFGIYSSKDGTGSPLGTQVDNVGLNSMEHAMVATQAADNAGSSIYPAFSLSGDYNLEGEFDFDGTHYSCLIKVQVRAPGIRAEACWDTEGMGVDLDLHMARVDHFPQCASSHGWSDSCTDEDCYYGNCKSADMATPDWGYTSSAASTCAGWGTEAASMITSCGNPRLDRDANGGFPCDTTQTNPNGAGEFCGPENINVDGPADGSRYAVALKYFAADNGNDLPTKGHVNVYCDGARVLSAGYNPITGNNFPQLDTSGANTDNDMWKVALLTTHGVAGAGLNCEVNPTQSQKPHTATDGSNAYCVDTDATDGAQADILLAPGGLEPLDSNAICFH